MAWEACGGTADQSSEGSETDETEEVSNGADHQGSLAEPLPEQRRVSKAASWQERRPSGPVVDFDALMTSTVTSHVNAIGTGRYQWAILVGIGLSCLAESIDMSAVGPLHAALGHAFNLDAEQRTMLTAFTYMGAGFAVLFVGPLVDFLGRKVALLSSVIAISVSFLLLSVLPTSASFGTILLLRAIGGSALGVGGMAGTVLAVESCPTDTRSRYMFGINFVASCGYLIGAWLNEITMPGFGEEPADNWRCFCVAMGISPLLSMPFLFCICESPLFLAATGDLPGARRVLQIMADMNGKAMNANEIYLPERETWQDKRMWDQFLDGLARVSSLLGSNTSRLLLLCVMDGTRSFFTAGSSYLWKDLFYPVGRVGSKLNTLCSLSPLVGLGISHRVVWIGAGPLTLICSLIAAAGLLLLLSEYVQRRMYPLLTCVMIVKLTYGPLVTSVNLMKAEVFPTEVRASAFSLISVVAKFACMVAPSMIEEMRGTGWSKGMLAIYLILLMVSVLTTGVLTCWVPQNYDASIEDIVGEDRQDSKHNQQLKPQQHSDHQGQTQMPMVSRSSAGASESSFE